MARIKERYARLTTKKMVSTLDWAGISTIASGTTVVSIAAAQAVSGAVVFTQPVQFTLTQNSANFATVTLPMSVGNGSFIIATVGSVSVPAPMNIAWMIINQSK